MMRSNQSPLADGTKRPDGAETPLSAIRVVDFTHFIAGPYCTMILADFGAEVLKIESADGGDGFRHYPPRIGDEGVPYLWTNRNKSSIALDLKTEAGRQIALELVDKADIVVENFSTGVMERLGLDYERVAARNPRLIYCSISAYGRKGRFADRIGFDPILQAESGFISMNGFPDQEGVRAGPSIMDIATAMMSANAILAALAARERTGRGQYVETTLLETAVNMLGNFSMACLATGETPTRFGNTQPTACPVGSFETASGPIYLACANDRTFRRLATDVLNRPDLTADERYADSKSRRDNRDTLMAVLRTAFRSEDRQSLLDRMHAAGVPAGSIRNVREALDSEEVRQTGMLSMIPHPTLGQIPNVALPVHFSATPTADPVAAPLCGADTQRVLKSVLGYDDARLQDLTRMGALGATTSDDADRNAAFPEARK